MAPLFELIVLFALCAGALSILWYTLRTGISPMPGSRKARRVIACACRPYLSESEDRVIIDFGSGWGGLLFSMSESYPEHKLIGYELSWLPWAFSVLVKQLRGFEKVEIRRKDFLKPEMPANALMICYLHPAGMQRLAEKINAGAYQGAVLISFTFALPGIAAEQEILLNDIYRSRIYTYRL